MYLDIIVTQNKLLEKFLSFKDTYKEIISSTIWQMKCWETEVNNVLKIMTINALFHLFKPVHIFLTLQNANNVANKPF